MPYPQEFGDDVVRVARNREPAQQLKQIAADLGTSESRLANWIKKANAEDGITPETTMSENADLREARERIRLLEILDALADTPDHIVMRTVFRAIQDTADAGSHEVTTPLHAHALEDIGFASGPEGLPGSWLMAYWQSDRLLEGCCYAQGLPSRSSQ